jgi:hypothetical protein
MKKILFFFLIFLFLSPIVYAQDSVPSITYSTSLKGEVIMSPTYGFIWYFQRGIEEVLRFTKFTPAMRVGYSLDLSDRRVGEMEMLTEKNNTDLIPTVEKIYETEIGKIENELGESFLSSILGSTPLGLSSEVRTNVTQRLDNQINTLNAILGKVPGPVKVDINNAINKANGCKTKI